MIIILKQKKIKNEHNDASSVFVVNIRLYTYKPTKLYTHTIASSSLHNIREHAHSHAIKEYVTNLPISLSYEKSLKTYFPL